MARDDDDLRRGGAIKKDDRAPRILVRALTDLAQSDRAKAASHLKDFMTTLRGLGLRAPAVKRLEAVAVAGQLAVLGQGAATEHLKLARLLVTFDRKLVGPFPLDYPHNHAATALVRSQMVEARRLLAETLVASGTPGDLEKALDHIVKALVHEPSADNRIALQAIRKVTPPPRTWVVQE